MFYEIAHGCREYNTMTNGTKQYTFMSLRLKWLTCQVAYMALFYHECALSMCYVGVSIV